MVTFLKLQFLFQLKKENLMVLLIIIIKIKSARIKLFFVFCFSTKFGFLYFYPLILMLNYCFTKLFFPNFLEVLNIKVEFNPLDNSIYQIWVKIQNNQQEIQLNQIYCLVMPFI